MRVLVTGASGFLGHWLCRALRERGDEVVTLSSRDADLTQPGSLEPWSHAQLDQIYHLAAWTQAGDFCLRHPGEQWIINQHINTHVLTWWQQNHPQARLIAVGSSCCYDPDLPLIEENFLRGQPIESLLTYAMTKRMLYAGLLALGQQFDLRWLCVVPTTLYGPGYHTDGRQMHFIFDLARKILRGKLYGEPVVLWGDGQQRREIMHVRDFVQALLQLESVTDCELVNLGAGEDHTIRSFAEQLSQLAGYDAEQIEYDTTRYVGARAKCLDTSRLRRLLPGLSLTSLDAGLQELVEWFLANRDQMLPPDELSAAATKAAGGRG